MKTKILVLALLVLPGCGVKKTLEATQSVPAKLDLTNAEVKKSNTGIGATKDEVKKSNEQIGVMVSEVKESNQGIGTMIGEVRESNSGIHTMIGSVRQSNSGIRTMIGEVRESNSGIKTMIGEVKQSNVGIQTMIGEVKQSNKGIQSMIGEVKQSNSGIQTMIGEVKQSNSGIQTMIGEVKQSNVGIQTMIGEVKESNTGIQTMIGEVKQSNTGIGTMIGEVKQSNTGIGTMISEVKESNVGISTMISEVKKSNLGITKTNAAVHNQTLAVALAEMLSKENTRYLFPPTGMMPAGQVFANEASATEIVKLAYVFLKEIDSAVPDDSERDEFGGWRKETIRTVDQDKRAKFTAAYVIAGLAPQETIEKLVEEQIEEGGRYEATAYAVLMMRYMFIHDYLLQESLFSKPLNNPGTIAEAIEQAKHLSYISDRADWGKVNVRTVGMLEPSNNIEVVLKREQTAAVWKRIDRAFEDDLQAKYKDSPKVAALRVTVKKQAH